MLNSWLSSIPAHLFRSHKMAYSPTSFTDMMDDQEETMGYQPPAPPVSAPSSARSGLPQGFSLRTNASQPASTSTMPASSSFDSLYRRTQAHQEYNPAAPSMPNQMFSPFQSQQTPQAPPSHSASWTNMPSMSDLSLSSNSPTSINKRKAGANGGMISLRSSTMSPDSGSSATPMIPDLTNSRSPLLGSGENVNRVDIHTLSDDQHLTYIKRRGHVVYHDMNDAQLSQYKMEELCGLQQVETCLQQNIINPLAQPQAYSLPGLYQSLLWFDGKAGCGMRSAILAKLRGVCNVLIYRPVDDGKMPDDMFFVDLLLFAIRKSPCAVVMHRADAAFAARQSKAPGEKFPEGVFMAKKILQAYASAWKRMIDTSVHNRIWSIHVQQWNPSIYDNYYRSFFVDGSRAVAKVADMRNDVEYTISVFKILLNRYLDFSQNEAIDKDGYINQVSVVIQSRLIQYKQEEKEPVIKRPRDLCDIISEVIMTHRATVGMAPTIPALDLFGTALEKKRETVQREMAMRIQGEQLKMQA